MRQKTKERWKAREAVSSLAKRKSSLPQTKQTGRMCSHEKATKTEIPHAGHGILHTDYHAGNHLGCIHANEGDFYGQLC